MSGRLLIALGGILLSTLASGCGSAGQYIEVNEISSEMQTEIEPESTEIIEQPTEECVELPDWKAMYALYLENMSSEAQEMSSYCLIYLDDDDIPELWIDRETDLGRINILTCKNDEIAEQYVGIGSMYIERSGLLYSLEGRMGFCSDLIYKLYEGEFSLIAEGTIEPDNGSPNSEEANDICMWNGQSVSFEEYMANREKMFDTTKVKIDDSMCSYEEVRRMLNQD